MNDVVSEACLPCDNHPMHSPSFQCIHSVVVRNLFRGRLTIPTTLFHRFGADPFVLVISINASLRPWSAIGTLTANRKTRLHAISEHWCSCPAYGIYRNPILVGSLASLRAKHERIVVAAHELFINALGLKLGLAGKK